RWREGQRAMWPVPVVMIDEHFKGSLGVRLVQNQQPVKTFRADGAHESLGDPVGLGRAKRRPNDLNPLASEHRVKPVGEFLIAIANQKPHRFRALRHGPGQLPRLLTDPWRVGVRRATGHLHAAAAQFDDKEDVEPYMDSSRWSNERSMRWRTQSYRCGRISGLLMDALRRPATMDSRDIRGQSL